MGRTRRGFGLVGVILLILIFAGVGLAIAYFARHADRSSHWFWHSQVSHDLADAGLRQAMFLLSRANSAARAAEPGPAHRAAATVFTRLTGGQPGETAVTLFTSDDPSELPEPLRAQLDALSAQGFTAALSVTLDLLTAKPFWDGAPQGIPLQTGERKGTVRITARSSVKSPVGVRVERTLYLEKDYRVISVLPPLIGRFSLFLHPKNLPDPNVFHAHFDDNSGDGVAEAGNVPIILQSRVSAPLVAAGSSHLGRSSFLAAVPDPKFLDHQGWVYLGGPEEGQAAWRLKLTHGFGPAGESPLLNGEMRHVRFKDSDSEDQGFRQRWDDAFQANAEEGCQTSLATDSDHKEGLEQMLHGWATNYEQIGMDPSFYELVQSGGSRIAPKLGDGNSSCLRLFGTPDRFSPTVVFGPVQASFIRRAEVECQVGPEAFCNNSGMFRLNLFRIDEHPAKMQPVLQAAFGGDYDTWGTNVQETPLMDTLNVALDGQGDGDFAPNGVLARNPGGGARALASDYFPWVSRLGSADGIPNDDLTRLLDGRMDVPAVYSGSLRGGLRALQLALIAKLTFVLTPEAAHHVLGGPDKKMLEVPGIVLVYGGKGESTTLVLPPDLKIDRGGILINQGPIEIQGDITRQSASEPLTLVSLSGDITVDSGVRKVDAVLAALHGRVDVQTGSLAISGGVACKDLDFEKLHGMTDPLTITHADETDPTGGQRDGSLRAYYGTEDRLVVTGSTP